MKNKSGATGTLQRGAKVAGSAAPPVAAAPVTTAPPMGDVPSYAAEVAEVIRRRAYEKWEAAGRPEARDVQFWLEAEREVLLGKAPPGASWSNAE